jgi:hypothetical protein
MMKRVMVFSVYGLHCAFVHWSVQHGRRLALMKRSALISLGSPASGAVSHRHDERHVVAIDVVIVVEIAGHRRADLVAEVAVELVHAGDACRQRQRLEYTPIAE